MKMIISAVFALIVSAIWYGILTFIAFAITKSGGTGEWVNDLKIYVAAFIFVITFMVFLVQFTAMEAKQNPFRRRRYK